VWKIDFTLNHDHHHHHDQIWKNYEEDQPQTARTTWKEVEGGSSPQNTQKNSCNSLDQHEEKASNVHYICDGFETIRNCIVRVGKGLSVGSKYGLRLRSSSSSCILHHKDNNQLKEYYDEQQKEKKYCCKEHSITSCDVLLPGVVTTHCKGVRKEEEKEEEEAEEERKREERA